MKLLHKLIISVCNLEAFQKRVGKICADSNTVIKIRLEGTSGGQAPAGAARTSCPRPCPYGF